MRASLSRFWPSTPTSVEALLLVVVGNDLIDLSLRVGDLPAASGNLTIPSRATNIWAGDELDSCARIRFNASKVFPLAADD
jgi:hypothetical protein